MGTRGPAISSWISTLERPPGGASATTWTPSCARCARPAFRSAWPNACGTGFEPHVVIGGRRPLQGRKPGDRRVRVERPHTPYFRYTGPGQLTAKQAASAPTTGFGRTLASVRGYLFGRVLASEEELGER